MQLWLVEALTLFRFVLAIALIAGAVLKLNNINVLPILFILGWASDMFDGQLARKFNKKRYLTPITDESADYTLAIAAIVIFGPKLRLKPLLYLLYITLFVSGLLFKEERMLMLFVATSFLPMLYFYWTYEPRLLELLIIWLIIAMIADWKRFSFLVKRFLGVGLKAAIALILILPPLKLSAYYFNYLTLYGEKVPEILEFGAPTQALARKQIPAALALYHAYEYPQEAVNLALQNLAYTKEPKDLIPLVSFSSPAFHLSEEQIQSIKKDDIAAFFYYIYTKDYSKALKIAPKITKNNKPLLKFLIAYTNFRKHDLNTALVWIQQYLKDKPEDMWGNLLYTELYYKGGQFSQSYSLATQALKKFPQATQFMYIALKSAIALKDEQKISALKSGINRVMDPSVIYHTYAQYLLQKGDTGTGLYYTEKAKNKGNTFFEAQLYTTALLKFNSRPKLKKWAEEALTLDLPYSVFLRLAAAFENSDPLFAVELYKKALNNAPLNIKQTIYTNAIALLLSNSEYPKLIDLAKKAISDFPANADFYYALAFAYQNNERSADAIEAYKLALKYNPQDVTSFTNLLFLLNKQRLYGEALETADSYSELLMRSDEASFQYATALFSASKYEQGVHILEPLYDAQQIPRYGKPLATALMRLGKLPEALNIVQQLYAKTDDPSFAAMAAEINRKIGDKQETLKWYKIAVQKKPRYLQNFIDYLIETKNFSYALTYVDTYLTTFPESAQTNYTVSLIYAGANQPQKALHYIDKALKYAPDNEEFLSQKIELLSQIKNFEKAISYALKLLKRQPNNDNLLFSLGKLYEKSENYKNAEKYYLRALKKNERDIYYLALIDMFLRIGKIKDAISYLSMALDSFPNNPVFYYKGAILYKAAKDYKKAEDAIRNAIKYAPAQAEYYTFLISIYIEAKEWEKGYNNGLKFLKKFPKNPLLLAQIGVCAKNLNRLEDAADYYEQALQLEPQNTQYQSDYLNILITQKKYSKALERAFSFLENKPVNPAPLYYNIGLCYQWLEKYDSAVVYYQRALEKEQKPEYYLNLIQTYELQKKYDEIIKLTDKLSAFAKDYPTFYTKLALAYMHTKQFGKAEDYISRAIEALPHSPEVHLTYAEILFAAEQKKKALKELNTALDLGKQDKSLIDPKIFRQAYTSAAEAGYTEDAVSFLEKYFSTGIEDEQALSDYIYYSIKLSRIEKAVQFLTMLVGNEHTDYFKNITRQKILHLNNYTLEQNFLKRIYQKYPKIYKLSELLKTPTRKKFKEKIFLIKGRISAYQNDMFVIRETDTSLECGLRFEQSSEVPENADAVVVGKYETTEILKSKDGIKKEYPVLRVLDYILFK